jgi:D-sedoheptulose 7-phosphate isomerase
VYELVSLFSNSFQYLNGGTMDLQIDWLKSGITDSIEVKQRILADEVLLARIMDVAEHITSESKQGHRIIFGGNGGSAADAQHLAAEFVSRFEFDRPGLPALSLSTDTSMITAIGNDYGYEHLFLRQLQAQAKPGDVFVGLTTSGRSPNVLAAFKACKELGVTSVALCGKGGPDLETFCDHVLRVPSDSTPRIQESHILIGHMLCAFVEHKIFGYLKPR